MARFIILSQIQPQAFNEPRVFRDIAAKVKEAIKQQCPGVKWLDSYATSGQFDVVDLVEADGIEQVEKAALIIRGLGHAMTQTMVATPWDRFLQSL